MPQIINTNIASLNSQRNLNMSQTALQTSLQRLSSGLRINSAKDDAAGLGIADRFTSQIRGLNQAIRNANDGISLSQTAEGALGTMGDNLQRMRELAIQSANATNTTVDRLALQAEVAQLIAEIDRVATTTQFNGTNLLDGTFNGAVFQVGANSGQTIAITMESARSAAIGTGTAAAVSALGNPNSASAALATGDVVINGIAIGGSSAADDASSSTRASFSAISKAAAINKSSSLTGVTAVADPNIAAGSSMTAASRSGTIILNGVTTSAITTTTDAAVSRSSVEAAINAISAQTGVSAIDTGDDASGVKLIAADGRNIQISLSNTLDLATTGLFASSSMNYGSYSLLSDKTITIAEGTGTIANSGLRSGTYVAQVASVTASAAGVTSQLASGDVKINGVLVGASLASYDTASVTYATSSAISKATAINKVSAQTGVTASAKNEVTGAAQTGASVAIASLVINGVTSDVFQTTGDIAKDRALAVTAINNMSGRTGVYAVDGGSSVVGVKLIAADGRNITITSSVAGINAAVGLAAQNPASAYVGRVTLNSAGKIELDRGTSVNGTGQLGIPVGTYGSTKSGQAISTLDISTVNGALKSLTAIDNALAQINSARGALGAAQNRFNATVANLQTSSENMTASRSRIQDADFAAETAALTRAQILQQAGVAMLAQANALPNQVLSLLRGG